MIIGISGKKQSGKDTVARIIQQLTVPERLTDENGLTSRGILISPWRNVKFSDKLKDMVCLLIGCNKEDLESEEFKNKELGEQWKVWRIKRKFDNADYGICSLTKEEAEFRMGLLSTLPLEVVSEILTPRKILQLLGTDCVRNLIHPNAWVNATMADYKFYCSTGINVEVFGAEMLKYKGFPNIHYPKWIISDVRFPNEVEAVKQYGGISLRIERPSLNSTDTHESETALDYYNFDYTIINDGSIEKLEESVKDFLEKISIL